MSERTGLLPAITAAVEADDRTVGQIARQGGATRVTLARWLRGERSATLERIDGILAALGLEVRPVGEADQKVRSAAEVRRQAIEEVASWVEATYEFRGVPAEIRALADRPVGSGPPPGVIP